MKGQRKAMEIQAQNVQVDDSYLGATVQAVMKADLITIATYGYASQTSRVHVFDPGAMVWVTRWEES